MPHLAQGSRWLCTRRGLPAGVEPHPPGLHETGGLHPAHRRFREPEPAMAPQIWLLGASLATEVRPPPDQ